MSSGIPKVEEPDITPLNKEEQERLFAALKGEEFEDLILVDLFTGLRCGELLGLTWDCIDFENGIIHVKKQLSLPRKKGGGGKCYWSTLKNGKSRIVLPAPFVMDVLRHHKAVQASQKLAAGPLWDEGDFPNLVFTHPNGYHYIQPTIWKEFQKILKKAGLQHYRVHDLRHTFAVNSIKAGDEATSALDPITTSSILALLKRLNRETGITMVIITHQMQVVKELCRHVAVMEKGTVVEQGDVFQIFAWPKEQVTRSFVDSAGGLLPERQEIRSAPGDTVLQLKFYGKSANDAVVSQASRRFGLDLNILSGNIETVDDRPLGKMTVSVSGSEEQLNGLLEYLEKIKVDAEVIKHADLAE